MRQTQSIMIGKPIIILAFAVVYCVIVFNTVQVVNAFQAGRLAIIVAVAGLPLMVLAPEKGLLILPALFPFLYVTRWDVGGKVYYLFNILIASIAVIAALRAFYLRKGIRTGGVAFFLVIIVLGAMITSIRYEDFSTLARFSIRNLKLVEYSLFVCALLSVFNLVEREKQISQFYKVFIFSLSVYSVLALIQYFFEIPILYSFRSQFDDPYSYSSYLNAQLFGGYMANPNITVNSYLLVTPFILSSFIYSKKVGEKLLWGSLGVLLLSIILLAQSRSAMAGIFLVSVGIVMSVRRFKPIQILSFVLFLGVMFFLLGQLESYMNPQRFETQNLVETGIMARLKQYRVVAEVLLNHPLGIGMKEYTRISIGLGGHGGSPHHFVLFHSLHTGLAGGLSILALYFYVIAKLLRVKTSQMTDTMKILRVSLAGGLVAHAIHNSAHNAAWDFSVWMFLGLSLAYLRFVKESDPVNSPS